MSLEILMGNMFSGKSSELIRRVKRHEVLDRKTRIINHSLDNRTENNTVMTHDCITKDAVSVNTLVPELFDGVDVVAVDETQFFTNLRTWVVHGLKQGKHIILAGLDGDFQQNKFGELLDVIPLADEVVKLRALCMVCKDGTPGPFTQRTIDSNDQVLVAGSGAYKAVCRHHLNSII